MAFREIKHHLDGRTETWGCEALGVTGDRAVVTFVLPARIGPWPKGSTTYGFFWTRRDYNLYRFVSKDGETLGHRFDVVTDVRIDDDSVEYLDLVVDVVVDPLGEVTVEDEDEAKQAAKRGSLTKEHLGIIERALRRVVGGHKDIVREAVQLADELTAGG